LPTAMPSYSDIVIKTSRLELRPLAQGDESRLFEIHSDPEFMRYWSSPPWTSLDQATALIQRDQAELAAGIQLRLGVRLAKEALLIGTCCLFKFHTQCRRAEVGYGIARASWRNGYMAEALSALIDFGFAELNLNRIEADIDPRNVASAKILEKLGFLREGYLRQRWIVDGEVSDSALYGLLAEDWNGVPANPPFPPTSRG
jgi:ribosomal-protein-alanine N-acetyltransferase